MNEQDVLKKLEIDEHYYGDFGKKYLSNSDISTLLTNPLALGQPSKPSPAFLVGGYFHTAILEPEKLKKFKIVESTTRNTKAYKEISGGELCLLQHEVDKIELMTEKVLKNNMVPLYQKMLVFCMGVVLNLLMQKRFLILKMLMVD